MQKSVIAEKHKQLTSVFVALSGGVDSAVSAAILKQQGYHVTGVFMKNWSGDSFGIQTDCPWEKDQADAQAVCDHLQIPFRSFNFEKAYREKVISYFLQEIKLGRTPNPDVMCNKEIKFHLFLVKALEMGADLIATGHYAQIRKLEEYYLLKGKDANKDQSYFLHQLTQEQLSRTLFPVGGLTKPEVRKLAKKFGIPVAQKPDSQGICFVGEINVGKFLRANIPVTRGPILDIDNHQQVGTHDGVAFYTIGQREGLKIGGAGLPYYVAGKDKVQNILYVAKGNKHRALYRSAVKFSQLHLINKFFDKHQPITAVIRYRQKAEFGELDLVAEKFTFVKPQRAIAEGQSIVFYQGDVCLGGAVIEDQLSLNELIDSSKVLASASELAR